ncbi:hypothetical protein CP973_32340 [Streptomyces albofaciens JCM 4342]|uniref:hypothetical protein n=1 Tax=Streptomyces albofaciens TaxID=66866 RepID=UPI00123B9BED|nr:hypothetical protein [Streptomyces albofaciens]KAA6213873.1 hypothetical protein CP973_32340 [Streptomyces albofaciens JCM 4342]
MERVRRSAVATLLLLLAVTFAPLLCRVGGVQAVPAARAAVAQGGVLQAAMGQGGGGVLRAAPAQDGVARPVVPEDGAAQDVVPQAGTAQAADRAVSGPAAHYAVAQAPKKCSGQHAPSQSESAPVPVPNRGEPLTPAATGPAPLAAHAPACFALARPPTGTASATDHTALLPVLRM